MKTNDYKKIARIGLGLFLLTTGVGHLTFLRKDFRAQVPKFVPLKKDKTVVYSGYAEIALALALIFAGNNKKVVGATAAAFFAAVFPGNIAQYKHHRSAFGLNTNTKRFIRLLFQPVLIYWALESTGADVKRLASPQDL